MSEQSFLCTYSVKTRDKSTYEEERQAQEMPITLGAISEMLMAGKL
ncbi:hypothetical protein [Vibrio anguillarum]|nr:hypothetical protein [Vibrio anguillarum]